MNRTRIVVTVCHPEGHYQMVELPPDHQLTVDGMGAVVCKDLSHTLSDASEIEIDDMPMQLRLLAHPFTGLTMSNNDRQVLASAADLIERLEARNG
jgi:hypothetical protein